MSKIKRITKVLAVLLAVVGFGYLLFIARKFQKQKTVAQIIINDDNPLGFIDHDEIMALIENYIDPTSNTAIQKLNLEEIETSLAENKYVKSTNVFVDNRGNLKVNISQKRPLYRVINNSGVSYYLDKNRNRIPLSNKFTANVPVATGYINFKADSLGQGQGEAIMELTKLFEFVKKDSFLNSLISQVIVKRNGDLEIMPRTGYHSILVGNTEDLESKFERLKIFYKEGLNRTGWDKYDEVNLKYDGQVIAKTKNDG